MTTNISNPSPSHYAEPQWQALLKTAILPEGSSQHNAKEETFSSKQSKKSRKLILGLPLSELHSIPKLLAFSTCEKVHRCTSRYTVNAYIAV